MSDLAQGVQVQFKAGNKVQPHGGVFCCVKNTKTNEDNEYKSIEWSQMEKKMAKCTKKIKI